LSAVDREMREAKEGLYALKLVELELELLELIPLRNDQEELQELLLELILDDMIFSFLIIMN
jgi:hypothetical protein